MHPGKYLWVPNSPTPENEQIELVEEGNDNDTINEDEDEDEDRIPDYNNEVASANQNQIELAKNEDDVVVADLQ